LKPLIGISPTPAEKQFDHGHFRQYALSDTYTSAVVAAGGIPVILPAHIDAIDDMLEALDGIIFSGGGDIEASHWGEEPHEKAGGFDKERDAFELQAIKKAVERDMPMLGICRGIQTINVALGGSLVQDIPDQMPGSQEHRQHVDGKMRDDVSHPVTIEANDNLLHRIIGDTTLETNSFHHQALKDVGEGLEVIARSEDGVIEAVWNPAMSFGLAVQWHPEMLAATHSRHAAIFDALVQAAARKKADQVEREAVAAAQ
jgi:putative glutamine amidotransferase